MLDKAYIYINAWVLIVMKLLVMNEEIYENKNKGITASSPINIVRGNSFGILSLELELFLRRKRYR